MNRSAACCLLSIAALVCMPQRLWANEEEAPRFDRDIRPILAQACFHCHGPDAERREGELRLDQVEGIDRAFEAGDLENSEAWQRITSDDPDLRMPPPDAPHQLHADDIAALRRWIEAGAVWQSHWAFVPPQRPALPGVTAPEWVANPIDAFILARLEQEGLAPAEPADRERLLRRVTFDLTGLPPTIDEIDAFLADESANAYERVVDRLLASAHYGERMTLAWMDAARYGDSSVFHADGPRDMWGWRDWVIDAYNQNKPFDQFTIEQLAGDLLPNATPEQQIATGFLRNNATTDEGGAIAEEFRVEYAVDRVKTTSIVWMGLTMECGQCHSHKYDPITQDDYYRYFAYFNQASDPGMQTRGGNQSPVTQLFDSEALAKSQAFKAELAALEARLKSREAEAGPSFQQWAEAAAAQGEAATLPGDVLVHIPLNESEGTEPVALVAQQDHKLKVHGTAAWSEGKQAGAFRCDGGNFIDVGDIASFERTDSFSYGAWINPQGNSNGAPLARMDDSNSYRGFDLYTAGGKVAVHIIHSWPGNAIKVTTKNSLQADRWQHVFATYDGSSTAAGITIYFDGVAQEWNIEQDNLRDTIRTDKPLYVGRRNPGSPFKGQVDEVRVYARRLSEVEVKALAGDNAITALLATPSSEWSDEERVALRSFYLHNHDQEYQNLSAEAGRLKSEIAAAEKPISSVMVMQDVPQPRMTYVLDRGNYATPDEDRPVTPGVPAVFPQPPADAPANRLGLAQWLIRPDHPLTSRVAVNRYWYMLFGQGLVKTLEDFGSQGEPPSHPELLDWLAVDFVESGWNVKRLVKQMVMSSTYRQSSRVTPELVQRDPENRLLGRGPRFRLQGEFIRDNALAAGGLLVAKIGGPSVKPYQPAGLWREVSLSGETFTPDEGEKLFRRGMYTYWKRSAPAPSLTIFDAPTRESCVVRRSRTNTPLQALVTLNDPQFVEAARALAQRVIREESSSVDRQVALAYRLATGLRASDSVVAALRESYEAELKVFQADGERAQQLLAVGQSPRDSSIEPAQHAAMTVIGSLILNLDVTLTRS